MTLQTRDKRHITRLLQDDRDGVKTAEVYLHLKAEYLRVNTYHGTHDVPLTKDAGIYGTLFSVLYHIKHRLTRCGRQLVATRFEKRDYNTVAESDAPNLAKVLNDNAWSHEIDQEGLAREYAVVAFIVLTVSTSAVHA